MCEPALIDWIKRVSKPLAPIRTGVTSSGLPLRGIRAILFDVYGTLLVSGSGDIGLVAAEHPTAALTQALAVAGIDQPQDKAVLETGLPPFIEQHHVRARRNGVEWPEVDIERIWTEWCSAAGLRVTSPTQLRLLAVAYECAMNPVWPMPGLAETLEAFRAQGIHLGIVSNAQFYTPALFPALTGRTLAEWGFDPLATAWSWQCGTAKPDTTLFEKALRRLAAQGIQPDEVCMVGNDMRNDIAPAARCGCRTVLFAGDRRSLRWRSGDPLIAGIEPDAVITDLTEPIVSV